MNDTVPKVRAIAYWLDQMPDDIDSIDERWMMVTIPDVEEAMRDESVSESTRRRLKSIADHLSHVLLP